MQIDIEVICTGCGEELSASYETDSDGAYIEVEPCSICMGGAEENGREDGYATGYADGIIPVDQAPAVNIEEEIEAAEETAEENAANDREAAKEC